MSANVAVTLDPHWDAEAYSAVPIAYDVREVLDEGALAGSATNRVMYVRSVAPFVKDYDALPDNAPRHWAARFDLNAWRSWRATRDGRRVGCATLAIGLNDMTGGRGDVGVLWDIRVAPDARRTGVASALLAAIEDWAPRNGIHWMMVETQNVNVPAYAFYRQRDFTLTDVRAGAYPAQPDEVRMILHRKLAGPHAMPDEVTTPRLVLKRRRATEAAAVKALVDANLDHLRAWMPWAMHEPSTLEQMTERLAKFDALFEHGLEWPYGIWARETGAHLGAVGVHPRVGPGGLEIGYWLDKDATGHGYATEATEAMTRVALAQPGVTHVQVRHDPRNVASEGIPRRLGFRHVLTIGNDRFAPDGSLRDTKVWQSP